MDVPSSLDYAVSFETNTPTGSRTVMEFKLSLCVFKSFCIQQVSECGRVGSVSCLSHYE